MAWQLRWVKLWCGEVCCGLSGLGSLGKVFSGESCRGVASHGAAWLGSWGEFWIGQLCCVRLGKGMAVKVSRVKVMSGQLRQGKAVELWLVEFRYGESR